MEILITKAEWEKKKIPESGKLPALPDPRTYSPDLSTRPTVTIVSFQTHELLAWIKIKILGAPTNISLVPRR